MATKQLTGAIMRVDDQGMTPTDMAAHAAASHVREYRLPAWYDDAHAREFSVEYLTPAEVEATIRRYITVKTASEPLRHISARDLSSEQWTVIYAADDEAQNLYDRLNRACALVYLPDGLRPAHLDHLAEFEAKLHRTIGIYRDAQAKSNELQAVHASRWSGAQFDLFRAVQGDMAEARAWLAEYDALYLIDGDR